MTSFHFLLVDDEKSFIETTAQRLRQRGFLVDCVSSGREALKLAFIFAAHRIFTTAVESVGVGSSLSPQPVSANMVLLD